MNTRITKLLHQVREQIVTDFLLYCRLDLLQVYRNKDVSNYVARKDFMKMLL